MSRHASSRDVQVHCCSTQRASGSARIEELKPRLSSARFNRRASPRAADADIDAFCAFICPRTVRARPVREMSSATVGIVACDIAALKRVTVCGRLNDHKLDHASGASGIMTTPRRATLGRPPTRSHHVRTSNLRNGIAARPRRAASTSSPRRRAELVQQRIRSRICANPSMTSETPHGVESRACERARTAMTRRAALLIAIRCAEDTALAGAAGAELCKKVSRSSGPARVGCKVVTYHARPGGCRRLVDVRQRDARAAVQR